MATVLEVGQTGLTTVEESDGHLAPGTCSKPAQRPLSLRSNFSWTFAGNSVYAGSQWAMLMVLAKLGSPERVDKYAIELAVTDPAIVGALAAGIVVVVHASTLRHRDAARTRELLDNLGTALLGMTVNGIGHADSEYGYGYPNYRSNGAQRQNGEESHSLPLLATTQPKAQTNGDGRSEQASIYEEKGTVVHRPMTACLYAIFHITSHRLLQTQHTL